MMLSRRSLLLLGGLLPAAARAWALTSSSTTNAPMMWTRCRWPRPRPSSSSVLRYSPSDRDGAGNGADKGPNQKNEKDEVVRMALVRSLQMQFYKNCTRSVLHLDTGLIHDLPLWRVPWTEVPGRTNVLNVHEPQYTHMVESILHGPAPWYLGHLHLPGGSASLRSPEPHLRLTTWEQRAGAAAVDLHDARGHHHETAAVLGTLLRISDYRRMQDGRLLLLVQAMERFVVTEVVQTLPYGRAHVRLLPDAEELVETEGVAPDTGLSSAAAAADAARSRALRESFDKWHRYEFEHTMLPLPLRADLKPEEVAGAALAKVLPFAAYSPVLRAETLAQAGASSDSREAAAVEAAPAAGTDAPSDVASSAHSGTGATLEERLLQSRILQVPPGLDRTLLRLSAAELEVELWLAVNRYLKTSKTPVSPIILGLLPPHHGHWPGDFVLERIGAAIGGQTELAHKYVPASPAYPADRRRRRFSYCAAALLERPADGQEAVTQFRQTILAVPSTKERLAYCLQLFQERFDSFQ